MLVKPAHAKSTAHIVPRRVGHTRPKAPLISLNSLGRLRVSNVMALLSISHSTLYAGIKTGRYPQPDGRDGKFPYWQTHTIRDFLNSA